MLHSRYLRVEKKRQMAQNVFWDAIDSGGEEEALTYLEICGIIASLLERAVLYGIRLERHPDEPNKKGDEA